MTTARFIWHEPTGAGRNGFAIFRRAFDLAAVPATAILRLFADSRYRLWVNGALAGYGPARFVPSHPEYDEIELAPLLRAGGNAIVVEVNARGAPAFDAMASIGGFIAWGGAGGIDLATPGAWRARRATAWDPGAPCFSFAQGPIEVCDTRELDPAWHLPGDGGAGWAAAVPLARQDAWGAPTARSIPLMDLAERLPAACTLVATLAAEERVGVRIDGGASAHGKRRRSPYALCVHSPRAQTARFGFFWGPHFCNGTEIAVADHPLLGNRQDGTVALRAGWNLIYGEPEVMMDGWPVQVAVPAGLGLRVSASLDAEDAAWFLSGGSVAEDELTALRPRPPATLAELPALPGGWTRVARGARAAVPSRDAGWDQPGTAVAHPSAQVANVVLPADGEAVAVFDFAGEFHGHALVEVDAPAGTVIDIAITERVRADGLPALYKGHWMANEAERFVVRGGRQRLECFHQRGGRWLAVIARGAGAPVTLRRVAVRDTLYPLRVDGAFASADPVLDWIWAASQRTLRACMEDAFVDCPWRERGCYVGDAIVQMHAARQLSSDLALARRCIGLFAQAQRADGQIPDVAPAWKDGLLADYTLAWIHAAREYWAASGDDAAARAFLPVALRALDSPAWRHDGDGLVEAPGQGIFLDWGIPGEARQGVTGPLNAWYAKALADAAELAARIGHERAGELAARHAAVAEAFRRRFWRGDRFVDVPGGSGLGLHTAALALAFGLEPAGRADAVIAQLVAGQVPPAGDGGGKLDTYCFYFLLVGFYRHGRCDLAEAAMRAWYGPMRDAGAWTLWENFHGHASLCHAWSAGPMRFLGERVLGVRGADAEPDRVLIAPESCLPAANGVVAHRRGPIRVAWRVEGELLHLAVEAPPGVDLTVRPAGPLAAKRLVLAR